MTVHWKTICFIALLLCASTALAGGMPPSGLLTGAGYKASNYMRWDTLSVTFGTGGATFKLYVSSTNDRMFITTSQDSVVFNKPLLGTTGHFTGALTSDAPVWIPNTGSYALLGNLLAASNGSWGNSGFVIPYSATTSPTTEGRALWNSYYNYLTIGDGALTRYLYPVNGTPTSNYFPLWHDSTGTTNDHFHFAQYALVTMPDVDTAGIGDGEVPYYDLASKTIKFQASGASAADTFTVFRTDHTDTTGHVLHSGDPILVDTSNTGDGNDTLLSVGADRDSIGYVGEAEQLLSVQEKGDSTVITSGANTYLKFANYTRFASYVLADVGVGSALFVGPGGGPGVYTSAPGRATFVGGHTYATDSLCFNYNASAGSPIFFYNSTTNTWKMDGDTLFGRGNTTSWIRNCQWAGAAIPSTYLSPTGLTYGQHWNANGAGGWYASADGGLWTFSNALSQWWTTKTGDTALICTRDSATDSTGMRAVGTLGIEASAGIVLNGGVGTPDFDYSSLGHLDSAWFDSTSLNTRNPVLIDLRDTTISLNLVNTANPWAVNEGGTGAATFTDGGVMIGNGTTALQALGVALNGQFVVGDGTTDPVLDSLHSGAGIAISIAAGGAVTITRRAIVDTMIPDSIAITLATGSVTSAKIADATIDSIDMAANAVRGYHVNNATLDTTKGITASWDKYTRVRVRDTAAAMIEDSLDNYLLTSQFDDSLNSQLNVVDVEIVRFGRPGVGAPGDAVTQYRPHSIGTDLFNARTEFAADDATDTIEAEVLLPQGVTRVDSLIFEYKVSDAVADSAKITEVNVYYGALGAAPASVADSTQDLSPADTNVTVRNMVIASNALNARAKVFVRWIVEGDNGEAVTILSAMLRCSRKEL
jgi:hypothetical protein